MSGTGSVYLNSLGRWEAAISIGNHKKVRRKVRSQEQAEAALAVLIEQYRPELGKLYHLQADEPYPVAIKKRPRQGVTVKVRWSILERDGFRCVYCGSTPDCSALAVDHIVPVALGGSDEPANLVTACHPCNMGKAGQPLQNHPLSER